MDRAEEAVATAIAFGAILSDITNYSLLNSAQSAIHGLMLKVASDKDELTILNNNNEANSVKGNLSFMLSGTQGSSISWSSDRMDLVSNTGIVQRPAAEDGNQMVTITAVVSKQGYSLTRIFVVTLLAQSTSVSGYVYNSAHQPLTGATVKIKATGAGVLQTETTDSQGAYRFKGLNPAQNLNITVTLATYQETTYGPFSIATGESNEVQTLTLLPVEIVPELSSDASIDLFAVGGLMFSGADFAVASPGQVVPGYGFPELADLHGVYVTMTVSTATYTVKVNGVLIPAVDLTNLTYNDGDELVIEGTAADGTTKKYVKIKLKQASRNAEIDLFAVGGLMFSGADFAVAGPGQVVSGYVFSELSNLHGVYVTMTVSTATYTVKVNGVIIPAANRANLAFDDGDEVVIEGVAADGTTKKYVKIKMKQVS